MENGARRIPPIPLETLVVLVWLFYILDGGFGATVSHLMVPELEQRSTRPARSAGRKIGVRNVIFPIDTFGALGGSALIDERVTISVESDVNRDLPSTFVPGRNLIFLTFAAAFAYQRGIKHLVTGVAQTDYSGYPDCREETIKALQEAISLGMEAEFEIHIPLMHLSKKKTVLLAKKVGGLAAMADTHTCYEGSRPPCGTCPACELRAKGFDDAGIADPLLSARDD